MKQFRGGLVSKAHRLVYHSTLDVRVIKKKKNNNNNNNNNKRNKVDAASQKVIFGLRRTQLSEPRRACTEQGSVNSTRAGRGPAKARI